MKDIPAFPVVAMLKDGAEDVIVEHYGITIRDYFAAKAMQALIHEYFVANGQCMGIEHPYRNIPGHSYRMADAMLKAREGK